MSEVILTSRFYLLTVKDKGLISKKQLSKSNTK
jgi:hypothetical protein